jgi:hypothetical protein
MARIRETIERAGKGAGLNAGERRTFRNLLSRVLGISGTLREGSTSIGAPTASVKAGGTLER